MAEETGRDPGGRFARGNKIAVGHGKAETAARLALMRETVTPEQFVFIIKRNVRDAMGVQQVVLHKADGTDYVAIVDDPNSDGSTRDRARRSLYDYLLGKPPQTLELTTEQETPETILAKYSDEELEQIIALSRSANGDGGLGGADADDAAGAGGPALLSGGAEIPSME